MQGNPGFLLIEPWQMYAILKKMQPCSILNAAQHEFLTYQYKNPFIDRSQPAEKVKTP